MIDGTGNVLAPTYPRRAKGLVKNGRARFLDENTLWILFPPPEQGEIRMSELTAQEILQRIDHILNDVSHLHSAFMTIEKIPCPPAGEPDAGQARAEAVSAIVCAREETNRQALSLLEKMYEDLYYEDVEDEEE